MGRLLRDIDKETIKNTNRKRIILLALSIIAMMVILFNLGRSIVFPIPWVQEFETNGTAMQAKGNDGRVIIDRAYARLSFLNKDGKITKVVDGKGLALRRFYRQVVTDGETFYVLDNEIGSDSIYTKNEHIIAYEADGRVKNILYSADYHKDDEKQKIYGGRIKNIKATDDGVIAFFWEPESREMGIHRFIDTGEDQVIDEFKIPDQFGMLIDGDYDPSAQKFIGYSFSGTVFEHDAKGDRIFPMDPEMLSNIRNVTTVDEFNRLLDIDLSGENIPKSAAYSFLFIIEKTAFWIALVYLIILFIVKVIGYLKKLVHSGKEKNIQLIGSAVVIVALIFGISAFYSNTMQQSSMNSRASEVSSLTYTLANDPDNILTTVAAEALTDAYNQEKTENVERYLYNICDHNAENDANISIHLYKKTTSGLIIPICSSHEMVDMIVPWAEDREVLARIDKGGIFNTTYNDELGECVASVAVLKNNEGKIVGYVETDSDIGIMTMGLFRRLMAIFVTLLTVVVGIVLFFIELKGIINAKKKRRLLIEKGHPHPELAHFRSMRLCVEFVLKFDSVLMILIAKDLLVQEGFNNIALLVGLPATLMSVGMLMGQMVSDFCLPRFYVKKVIVIAAGLNAAIYAATALLIFQGSFWGYCVGIFFANICFGVMAGPSLIMPFLSGDEKMRFEMNNEKSMAGISASVISVMLAGFVAQYFGNYAIYLFALLPLAGVLFISLKLLPKATCYGRQKSDTKTKKLRITEYVKFLFSPVILILIVIVIIPSDTVGGYKSFFFPLFSQDYGLSKDFISNLVVLANFAAFVLNKPLTGLIKNKNYWFNTVLFLGISGLIYMSFKVNDSIIWATIVIVLAAIADKFLTPNINMLWPRQCMAKGLPPESFNSMFIYISNISSVIRPALMGVFLALGTPSSCIWLGIVLLTCAVLFAVLTSRSAMRTYQAEKL